MMFWTPCPISLSILMHAFVQGYICCKGIKIDDLLERYSLLDFPDLDFPDLEEALLPLLLVYA